jgi:hypothetical protein
MDNTHEIYMSEIEKIHNRLGYSDFLHQPKYTNPLAINYNSVDTYSTDYENLYDYNYEKYKMNNTHHHHILLNEFNIIKNELMDNQQILNNNLRFMIRNVHVLNSKVDLLIEKLNKSSSN